MIRGLLQYINICAIITPLWKLCLIERVGVMNFKNLDVTDNRILNLLKDNARMTYSEIGEEIGMSRVAVKNRITALEKKGIICGYRTVINPDSAPDTMLFYAFIETRPECFDTITKKLKNDSVVKTLCQMSGNNVMFLVGAARTKEERAKFAWRVRNTEGVVTFDTKDIWDVIKGNNMFE